MFNCRPLRVPDLVWELVPSVVVLLVMILIIAAMLRPVTSGLGWVLALISWPFRLLGRGAIAAVVVVGIGLLLLVPGPLSGPVGASPGQPNAVSPATIVVQVQWEDTVEHTVSQPALATNCDNVVTYAQAVEALNIAVARTPKKYSKLKSFRDAKRKMLKTFTQFRANGGIHEQGKTVAQKKWGRELPKVIRDNSGRIDFENKRGDRNLSR